MYTHVCTHILVIEARENTTESEVQTPRLRGTVERSAFTLFQMSTLESWAMALARPVLEERPWIATTILHYITLHYIIFVL